MAKQLLLRALKRFLNYLGGDLLRSTGRITLTAMLISTGGGGNYLWAQNFEIPEGFTSTIEHEEMENRTLNGIPLHFEVIEWFKMITKELKIPSIDLD